MAFEYELPDVGEGVAEGELLTWHVEPGDQVQEDEVLAEVETDKAVVDLPSPVNGTIVELHAEEGEIVPVGSVVVTLEVEGAEPDEAAIEPEVGDEEAPTGETESTDTGDRREGGPSEDGDSSPATAAGGTDGVRVFAPPNVRRLALELDVDITTVAGTGPGGRITEADVLEAAGAGGVDDETVESAIASVDESVSESSEQAGAGDGTDSPTTAPPETGDTPEGIEAADRDRTLAAPATRRLARERDVDLDAVPTEKTQDGEAFVEPEDVEAFARTEAAAEATVSDPSAAAASTQAPDVGAGTAETATDVTREPYRGVRRSIGEKMEESAFTAPHVSHHDTAVVDDLVETRAELVDRAADRDVSLTYLPFVMKAVVAGLQEYPVLNTTLDEDSGEVVYKHFYNIGVAVATDAGLMVPVVEAVDEKSILQIAADVEEVIARARDRSITPAEMQGGTFSITNFGAIGGEYATPIINYPETAILGLGSIEQRPVAEDGDVVARHTLPLSLSIDHRVIDGAEAARFANTVIEYLEDPRLLLLE